MSRDLKDISLRRLTAQRKLSIAFLLLAKLYRTLMQKRDKQGKCKIYSVSYS